jgi:hypothetical protein
MQLPEKKSGKRFKISPVACLDCEPGNETSEDARDGGQEDQIAESDDARSEAIMQLPGEELANSIKSISKAGNQGVPYDKKDEYEKMSRIDEAGFVAELAERGAWTVGSIKHDERLLNIIV